ncbi:hypothetical protein [Sphingobacterium sp. T2]|uniref:hypothetical protein n=1 Tax=Sphingobacterium sp. T2 TaxID=1590596 RepID=UPI000AF9CEFD|nr:hypothetical protein [Sphingobacterium sp. T2]
MKSKYLLLCIFISLSFIGCAKINSALDTDDIQYLSVNLRAHSVAEGVETTEGLKVVFENFTEGFRLEYILKDGVNKIEKLIPGTYSIKYYRRN